MSPTVGKSLPDPFDARVTWVLATALPEDVTTVWKLLRDGRLFFQKRTRTPGDWQVPFDRPWPDSPSRTLAAAEIEALIGKLESAGFFGHPGYQAEPDVDDGAFYVVRARNQSGPNAVVYQNITPAPVSDLAAVSDSLWKD